MCGSSRTFEEDLALLPGGTAAELSPQICDQDLMSVGQEHGGDAGHTKIFIKIPKRHGPVIVLEVPNDISTVVGNSVSKTLTPEVAGAAAPLKTPSLTVGVLFRGRVFIMLVQ